MPRLRLAPVTPQSQVELSTTELFNSNDHSSFTTDENIIQLFHAFLQYSPNYYPEVPWTLCTIAKGRRASAIVHQVLHGTEG